MRTNRGLRRVVCAGAAVGALAVAGIVPATAASAVTSKAPKGSPVVFHVVVSETGFAASLGATEVKAMEGLRNEVNAAGGIRGHPMVLTIKDNNSTPATAVSLASKWVGEKVPFILNGSVTAVDKAVDALATPSGPFIYDLSPGDTPKITTTVFSAGVGIETLAKGYLTYFKAKGLTKVAIINGSTSSGTFGYGDFVKALKTKKLSGITVTSHQTFTPTATSVTTQMAAIKASHPQALVIWVTGAPVGTVFKGMSSLGMETIPTVTTDGNGSYTLLTKLKTVRPKKLYIASGTELASPAELKPGPVRSAVAGMDRAVAAEHTHVGTGFALGYTPALLMVDALKKLGLHATAKQITSYMEHLHHVPGVFGYHTTSPKSTHRGSVVSDVHVYTFNGRSFVLLSSTGGRPLGK